LRNDEKDLVRLAEPVNELAPFSQRCCSDQSLDRFPLWQTACERETASFQHLISWQCDGSWIIPTQEWWDHYKFEFTRAWAARRTASGGARVRRHFDLYALWAELVTRSDLCRKPSCLAATEPRGAYGSRRRKREALET